MTLRNRLHSEFGLKLILTGILNLCFYVPYSFLQHRQFFAVVKAPLTPADRWIPFWDQAVWIYLSLFLLMPIGPVLMRSRTQLLRYATGILLIEFISCAIFASMPTWCPRPDPATPNFAYRMLTRFDAPLNAFPSLHASFAIFSALCAGQVIRELTSQAKWRIMTGIWAALIVVSALVTKQHSLADVGAGSLLGFCVYLCVFKQTLTGIKPPPCWQRGVPNNLHTADSNYES